MEFGKGQRSRRPAADHFPIPISHLPLISLFPFPRRVMLTRDQAKSLIDRIITLSRADDIQVTLSDGDEKNIRFADNRITTSGSTSDLSVRISSAFGNHLRAAESSASVASSTLLDHLRDEVEVFAHRGRDGLINRVAVGLSDFVGAQPLHQVERVGHGLDAGGIHRAQLVDEGEHAVQPRAHRLGLLGPDRDAGQPGDAPDLVVGKRHSWWRVPARAKCAVRPYYLMPLGRVKRIIAAI